MFIKSIFGKNRNDDAIKNVNRQLEEINKKTTDLLRKNDEIIAKLDLMQKKAEERITLVTAR